MIGAVAGAHEGPAKSGPDREVGEKAYCFERRI